MSALATYLLVAFAGGAGALALRLPPLVGFLAAGFVLNAMGVPEISGLQKMADIGVTLLLFTIGLKLDWRSLLQREVWLTASVHMVASIAMAIGALWAMGASGFFLLRGQDAATLALLGFALSFSSTVFVVKILQERSEAQSLYGRIAIGVLVMQDIAAVVFVTATNDTPPSPWAISLVLLYPVRELARVIWDKIGHGELYIVFGVFMALVPGYAWFDAVGLKGDLGALLMGALLASHPSASELSRTLFSLKEILLVAFFLTIGMGGLPTWETAALGLFFLLFLPAQALGYVALLWLGKLRHRTSILVAMVLANYSEFGLIVTAVGVDAGLLSPDWLVVMSIAVAGSFVFAALINNRETTLAGWLEKRLPEQPTDVLHHEDQLIDIGDANAVVMGMGRIGRTAYDRLERVYGMKVLGVESSLQKVEKMVEEGRNVVEGDATDRLFWDRLCSESGVEIAVLAMPHHGSNQIALHRLHDSHFGGRVGVIAKYDEELDELVEDGADRVLHLYDGAGASLADRIAQSAGLEPLPDALESDAERSTSR